jgi:trehalose 6-phosphate phosphatase
MNAANASPALPHALRLVAEMTAARARANHLFVGLDFDGTLAPIAPRPADAQLAPALRATLVRLAARPDTVLAVLSGRALGDVRERVAVPGIFYAGNHGLEISGPGIERVHPAAAVVVPALRRLRTACTQALDGVEGVIVEDKGVSLSVHYRLVADEDARAHVRATVREVAAAEPEVHVTEGKMVMELRPDVAWHKGAALGFLRSALHEDRAAPALFIGDDRTDEDAFRALPPGSWAIIVAEAVPAATAASAWLRDPAEVAALLERLAAEEAA